MSRLHHYPKIPNFCVPLPPSSISISTSMEVSSFAQRCSSTIITMPSHRSLLGPRPCTKPRCSFNLNPYSKFPSRPPKKPDPVPARDRIIKFGKHKGKMLGAIPSSYLQWMYDKSVMFPDLVKEVLDDPVYRDRIEWEYVQKILHHDDFVGGRFGDYESPDVIADIKEIADKFDWDMSDRKGWSKVKLNLLGTSFSGPIPRKSQEDKAWLSTKLKEKVKDSGSGSGSGKEEEEEEETMVRDRRRARRQRQILKSDWELGVGLESREDIVKARRRDGELEATEVDSWVDGHDAQVVPGKTQKPTVQKGSRFPGRGSLLEKAKVSKNRKKSS